MPATHVATTVQKFIVVVMPVTHVNYDCTEIYRRSQRGYRCSYDCTDIYRRSGSARSTTVTTTVELFIVVVVVTEYYL